MTTLKTAVQQTRSAYHLYRNFGENCPSDGTGIFFVAPKTEMALSCIIYKITVNLSLSLQRKPGSCNPKQMVQKFRSLQ